jgi:hypothetical protein
VQGVHECGRNSVRHEYEYEKFIVRGVYKCGGPQYSTLMNMERVLQYRVFTIVGGPH